MSFSKNDQRKVLLIDHDLMRQQLRAAALRNWEIEVHTAGNITDAGSFLRAHAYDLVLLAAQENSDEATGLCSELRGNKPRLRIALLVGAPQYVQEVGGGRKDATPAHAPRAPRPVIGPTHTEPTQWHAMIERLLATG